MSAFNVDLATGRLSVDTDIPPYFALYDFINADRNLLIDGYGVYSLVNGNVFVEGSGFAQPSRTLMARGTITLIDGTVIPIAANDIISFQTSFDIGKDIPLGATPSTTFSLQLANIDRRWDYGGASIGVKTLDGAIVHIEIGALQVTGNDDFIVTPSYSSGDLLFTGDGEQTLFSINNDGDLEYTGDNSYSINNNDLLVSDDLYRWAYEYMSAGYYVIDSIDNQEYSSTVRVSGCDYMGNHMMHEYINNLSYPATYQTIVADACEQAGVTLKGLSRDKYGTAYYDAFPFDGELIATPPSGASGRMTTCRDVVGWIAALAGANAIINKDGVLEIKGIDDTGEDIDPSRYVRLTTSNNFARMNYRMRLYEFNAPADTPPLEKVYADNDGAPYYIIDIRDNPYLAYGAAGNQAILDNRLNLAALWVQARHSARIEWLGNETIEPLQTITVKMLGGNEISVGLLQHRMEYDIGLRCESGCDLSSVTLSNSLAAYK